MSYRRRCPACRNLRARSYFKPGTSKCRVCRYAQIARRGGDPLVAFIVEALGHREAELRAALGRTWAAQIAHAIKTAEERVTHA